MRPKRLRLPAAAALLLAASSATSLAQELEGKTLAEWSARILPPTEDLSWESIGWRPTLWSALREAVERDRPLLLWAMNGHPLGCT